MSVYDGDCWNCRRQDLQQKLCGHNKFTTAHAARFFCHHHTSTPRWHQHHHMHKYFPTIIITLYHRFLRPRRKMKRFLSIFIEFLTQNETLYTFVQESANHANSLKLLFDKAIVIRSRWIRFGHFTQRLVQFIRPHQVVHPVHGWQWCERQLKFVRYSTRYTKKEMRLDVANRE